MTTPMRNPLTIADIERRLRFPAPDEPAVLPSLRLPTAAGVVREPAVRFRMGAPIRVMRPAHVVVLLVLALVAAVAAVGAVRLFQDDRPLAEACSPWGPAPDPIDATCRPVAVPDGWHVLGSGQLVSGDFSEAGLGYQVVDLVMSTVPIGGCASPGGPFPTAYPVGSNAFEQPYPTPDPGLACVRAAPLPDNAIRVVTMSGSRILGVDDQGGGIPDTSEPTAEAGWTELVDGRPARLTVTGGTGDGLDETRIWDVLWPGSIDRVLRIIADINGPDLETGRASVQQVVDAVTFKWAPPPIDNSDGDDVLRLLLDALERDLRVGHSDFYACFPREPGRAEGVIRGGPGGPLASALEVRCSSSIEASLAGVWRIVLEVEWAGKAGTPGDTIRTEYFSTGERLDNSSLGIEMSGGYVTSLAGRSMPDAGTNAWFPNAGYQLPDELEGALNLEPGSVARMLWPGEAPAAEPGDGAPSDSYYPGIVGTHMYVLDGPRVVDGDEWYQVQWESSGFPDVGWVRGTRDGRPQLAAVEPDCPTGAVTVGDLSWLITAERLLCFGGNPIDIASAVFVQDSSWIQTECLGEDGQYTPCADADQGDPAWLTGLPRWMLYGPGGQTGPVPGLYVWLDPSAGTPPADRAVKVTGHYDDPLAAGCRLPAAGGPGYPPDAAPAIAAQTCRARFVITSFEPVGL